MVDAAEATGRGPDMRNAGRVGFGTVSSSPNPACDISAKPRGSGVPDADSAGGGVGLPDLPREARGFGAGVSVVLGGRDIAGIWRARRLPARSPSMPIAADRRRTIDDSV